MKLKVFWILLPAVLWIALFCLRPIWMTPWCAVQPSPCQASLVNAFDRIAFQFHSRLADFISNLVQNAVGVFLYLLPILILRDWKRIFRLEVVLVTGTFWNGAMLELARAIAQRPRPLVMNSPLGDGANIHQYTSFYSGHTSFVALASVLSFLWMRKYYGKSHQTPKMIALAGMGLVILTASLRILGGRHYPTDTIAGALAGSAVALVVWRGSKLSFCC